MKRPRPLSVLVIAALSFCGTSERCSAQTESHSASAPKVLKFVSEIGVGWQTKKFGWMSFVSFSPDGAMVASDGARAPDDISGDLTLWSFPDGRLIKYLPIQPQAISADWKHYTTFHEIGEIETGKALFSLGNKEYAVHAFSPDGRYVAESVGTVVQSSHIRVIELARGKQVSAFGKHAASSLAISHDGRTLAAGYWTVVTLWDILSGQRLMVLHGFERYVDTLSFSPDGSLLAAGSDVGKLQLWDIHQQKMLHSIDIEGSHVSVPAFSPDGRVVAVGTYGSGTVWLIDVGTGKILDSYRVSDMGCGSVAFSPDGRFLITPSTGGLIKWPRDRGGTIRVFEVTLK